MTLLGNRQIETSDATNGSIKLFPIYLLLPLLHLQSLKFLLSHSMIANSSDIPEAPIDSPFFRLLSLLKIHNKFRSLSSMIYSTYVHLFFHAFFLLL